jgi:chitinase
MKNRLILALTLLAISLPAQWITGFYSAGNDVLPVAKIPWSKYTHVVHFAAAPGVDVGGNGNGTVELHYLTRSEIAQFVGSRPPGKKAIVCIKDNDQHLDAFPQNTAPGMIGTFVRNIALFVNSSGYDGVDLDWEGRVNVRQYTQLIALLRAAMPAKVILADMGNWDGLENVASASQSVLDQVNLMCYDMDAPGNGHSWYNAALFQAGNSGVLTCDWRVNAFTKAGVAPAKIGLGLPFYGRRWHEVTQALVRGRFTVSTVFYNQLVTDRARWRPENQFYDSRYKSDYLSIPALKEFDSYTGPQAIRDAAFWIKSKGLGGVMAFTLEYEYLPGEIGDGRYPLSTALNKAMSGSRP